MLAAQLWAIRRLAAGPDDGARRLLGMCGAVMTPGYLGEKYVRAHLRPGGWDPSRHRSWRPRSGWPPRWRCWATGRRRGG